MRSTSYGEQGIEKHPEKGSTLGIWGGPGHLLLDDLGLASWHVPSQQNPGSASLEKVTSSHHMGEDGASADNKEGKFKKIQADGGSRIARKNWGNSNQCTQG